MRSVFLIALLLIIAVRIIGAPVAGLLTWTWLSLMTPHKLAWGFTTSLPINEIVVLLTIPAWLFSREPKRIPLNSLTLLLLAFAIIITVTTFFAINTGLAWERWDKTLKVMLVTPIVAAMMIDRKRLHALTWVIVLSLGYFSVRGGLTTILSLGHSHVIGPPNSSIFDNNYLALAMTMTFPLMYYVFLQSKNRLARLGLLGAMGLSVVGVVGTYSRGGLIGLAIMGLFLWWHSRHRVLFAALGALVIAVTLNFMPESWLERAQSLKQATSQNTFLTRLDSWKVAYRLGEQHPYLGGGFGATEDPDTYKYYSRGESPFAGDRHLPQIQQAIRTQHLTRQQIGEMFPPDYTGGHAVHNIYLQVFADHGYPGLIVFLLLMAALWLRLGKVRRMARKQPESKWAADLALMMQISMVTFFVAGMGVSMSYYDLPYLFLGMVLALQRYLSPGPAVAPVQAPYPMSWSAATETTNRRVF